MVPIGDSAEKGAAMWMRRLCLVACAIGLMAPAAAFAEAPSFDRYYSQEDFVFAGCGFPVRVQIDGQSTDRSWFNSSGELVRLLSTGPFKTTLTNVASGKALNLNISGSLDVRFNPDGSRSVTIRGPWLLLYRPESLEPLPIVRWLFLFEGTRILTVAADGTRHVTWNGRFVDLCAALHA